MARSTKRVTAPVEIYVPFEGTGPPSGEIKVRELTVRKAIQLRTYDQHDEYPKLPEMWDAVSRYIHNNQLASNWETAMTAYELWLEDRTLTIDWPSRAFLVAKGAMSRR